MVIDLATRKTYSVCEYRVVVSDNSNPHLPFKFFFITCFLFSMSAAYGHEVTQQDLELISGKSGWHFGVYMGLGAKHMVTGYDHLLFLAGVLFLLRGVRDIAVYISLFALGHSITLISGVLFKLSVSPYAVDAIIGLSVAYKGFDNLGGFQRLFGNSPNDKLAVFLFGLFHGLGLATKLQDAELHDDGLIGNLIGFNAGVEIGQFAALVGILGLFRLLQLGPNLAVTRIMVNVGLMVAGFTLMAHQLLMLSDAG